MNANTFRALAEMAGRSEPEPKCCKKAVERGAIMWRKPKCEGSRWALLSDGYAHGIWFCPFCGKKLDQKA